jgi:GH24 family phage-related lysozyme (muramidase)
MLSQSKLSHLRENLYKMSQIMTDQEKEKYATLRRSYIGDFEGRIPHVYIDVVGKKTVGFGFNMDRQEAQDEWNAAFQQISSPPSFRAVYAGKTSLTNSQIDQLFDYSLQLRETQLQKSYHKIWTHLRPNERLATESAYYNGTSLVQGPFMRKVVTRYYHHLERYILERDVESLRSAVDELKNKSNRQGIRGLQLRRESEAELLSSFKVASFSFSS